MKNNNDKVKISNESDELTEKEHEQEHFDLLIDEHMCNNLCDIFCAILLTKKVKI